MLSLRIFLTLSVAAFLPLSFAQAAIPAPKGTFNYNLSKEPTTLNPITSTDAYASTVQAYVMDTLMTRNENTYDWQPALAEKAETSKDGDDFYFHHPGRGQVSRWQARDSGGREVQLRCDLRSGIQPGPYPPLL
jgi:ABC-type transport system substrate-binding protein